MKPGSEAVSIMEPAREIKVFREVDVIVVGGGPGGIGAAIAAARSGAKTVLIERYGHLGGMATGGLVNIIPNLSDIFGEQRIAGLVQEIIDRLDAKGEAHYPKKEEWGTTERRVVDRYLHAQLSHFYIRKDDKGHNRVLYTALVDPEVLKAELNSMVIEAGVDLLLHSWGTRPVMDGNTVKGVIFESKSGRQAVLGKVVIDSTGDGDILVEAGADFESKFNPRLRIADLALSFWLGNVDLKKVDDFKASQPEKYDDLMQELASAGGHPRYMRDLLTDHENVVWFHPFYKSSDQKDIGELNRVELIARKKALTTYEFFKKYVPGFEKCIIMLTAPQLGTQGGRRVIGEYFLTNKDMASDKIYDDTIAVFANNDIGELSLKYRAVYIPYRSLVPHKIDGLLVACRAFSSEDDFNAHFNLVPHCICFGQAAGTAAAMAVEAGKRPREVDYHALQSRLINQGVILPEEVTAKR
jgi:hypothetical protein